MPSKHRYNMISPFSVQRELRHIVELHVLSVQCYAWTEHKFASVCLSVCLSHFLSTRLQVKPHQRIFTVDSLKDADLRKDVPFGGLDDE